MHDALAKFPVNGLICRCMMPCKFETVKQQHKSALLLRSLTLILMQKQHFQEARWWLVSYQVLLYGLSRPTLPFTSSKSDLKWLRCKPQYLWEAR